MAPVFIFEAVYKLKCCCVGRLRGPFKFAKSAINKCIESFSLAWNRTAIRRPGTNACLLLSSKLTNQ
jgi:hypothetical protein